MKRIIVGYLIDGRNSGIDKYLLNFLSIVSEKNIQIDFLSNDYDEELVERLKKYGAKLYKIPTLKHPIRQVKEIRKIIREGGYNIAYFNISECINITGIYAAHREKVDCIIIHSHNSGIGIENIYKRNFRYILHSVCKIFLYRWGDVYLACSKKAGEWLFPKKVLNSNKFQIVNNAIQAEKFRYSLEERDCIREKLGLDDAFVVGHVGGFNYQKNHEYLVEIFLKLLEKEQKARLLLIGEGPTKSFIEEKVLRLGLKDKVFFLGSRNDVNVLMQGMDVFVLPSRFEGLPVVGIEASIAGLPCVFSDNISEEVKITDNCKFCSIDEKPEVWADLILSFKNIPRQSIKITNQNYCFDLKKQAKQLLEIIGER